MEKETMLGRIVSALISVPAEMLGTLLDLVNRLAGKQGQKTWNNLKHLLRGEFEVKLLPLIQWYSTTTTSATTEQFVAKDKFFNDLIREVKFYGIWDIFQHWFLDGKGKTEEPLDEQELRFGNLTKPAQHLPQKEGDIAIIPELGGEARAETTLTELWDLLIRQANGEDGVLLINGNANIFYIRDVKGVLRSVSVMWCNVAWYVRASSVGDLRGWDVGARIFSRNS